MDLGRNSWFTAKHEATISGPYPHHVYFTGNTWLFFCTASAAVKVNQSGDISYQNLKVGKICLQCEAPRWCFWFVYKSSNYNSIPHKPTELYPQVSAHVSHKYWVAVAHIVHICKHYILKGMCMYIYIYLYIYIFDYICIYIYTHRYTVAGRYNLSVLVVFSPLRIRLRRFDRFFLSQWHCKVICANRVSSSFLSFKMVKKKHPRSRMAHVCQKIRDLTMKQYITYTLW